uniref:SLC26A/SulP transporter domain-containing protein n=1 Tax=Trichogramma kaykai TaxID=54128 RepID=A0ABD2W9N0_9HYME
MQVGNNSNASTNGMDSRKMDELDMDADTPNYIEVNLKEHFVQTLKDWKINYENKSVIWVTDNASNMEACFTSEKNWVRIPCIAHTLQLAVKDVSKAMPDLENIRKKCSKIVTHFSHSEPSQNGEKYPTGSKIIPIMSELIEEVQNKSNTTQGFQKTLCSELYKSLKGRMTQYLDMPILKIAMITDPHYFNNFIESEEENDEIKELLFELAGRFAVDSNDNDEECLVFNDEIVKKPKSKLQCRIEEKIAMKQAACNKHDRNIKEEIERFLMERDICDEMSTIIPELIVRRPVYQQDDLLKLSHYTNPQKPFSKKIAHNFKKIQPTSCFRRTVPIFDWLPRYKWKKDLYGDIIAGVTVAVMHIPQGMAYAMLGNVPAITGIYMAFFPVLIYFIFGTSKHNSMGRL